jgi:hypothetical protein
MQVFITLQTHDQLSQGFLDNVHLISLLLPLPLFFYQECNINNMRVEGKSWIKNPSLYQIFSLDGWMWYVVKKVTDFQRRDINRFLSWTSSKYLLKSSCRHYSPLFHWIAGKW